MNKSKKLDELVENLKLIFGISLGIYLFILFFQPFNPTDQGVDGQLLLLPALQELYWC